MGYQDLEEWEWEDFLGKRLPWKDARFARPHPDRYVARFLGRASETRVKNFRHRGLVVWGRDHPDAPFKQVSGMEFLLFEEALWEKP